MLRIKRALISVWDKSGILDLAKTLQEFEVEILSTGGTAKLLRDNSIKVKDVSEYTGFPEMLDGRVKTLHPKIHAGLLALRDNPQHLEALKAQNIGLIDMVVVNLYPFEKTVQKKDITLDEAIENIDIGGPSMLRSAAKNHQSVAVVCDPARYGEIIAQLKQNKGCLEQELLQTLAVEVFRRTSEYDNCICAYLRRHLSCRATVADFADNLILKFSKIQDLRYGENPHQRAAFYKEEGARRGLINLKQLQGKELSFNNILDLNAAVELLKEFSAPAAVVVKHNNPCGAAEGKDLKMAFLLAWRCDPLSAFGSIVALNRSVDSDCAKTMLSKGFIECILAPGFDAGARNCFSQKKNLRLLELFDLEPISEPDLKRVSGGMLLQDKDALTLDEAKLEVVTQRKPTKKELKSLIFAWRISKHAKSNCIVLAKGTRTVGIGAGQMSRVDAVIIAARKAKKLSKNSCLASDAFFPKPDAIEQAKKAGVAAIIQPGGSLADARIIQACDKYKMAMVTTGIRHFRH